MSAGSRLVWWGVRLGPLPTISKCMVSFTRHEKLAKPSGALVLVLPRPLSRPRLSRASQNSYDYSGSFPLHRVHWSNPAGCVEGTSVSPRP